MVLAKFRQRYPQGSLVSELVDIDRGTYIVRASIQIENRVLATGLAAADRVEAAEDAARERAIAALIVSDSIDTPTEQKPKIAPVSPVESAPIAYQSSNTNNGLADNSHNNNGINSKENPPTKQTQPSLIDFSSQSPDSKPKPEPQPPEVTSPPATPTSPQPTSSSGNLFEGTQNQETTEPNTAIDDYPSVTPIQVQAKGDNISPGDTSEINSTSTANDEELEMADFNFTEIKQKTDLEIRRLGWTKDYGRDFLKSHYGKRSRLHLTNQQLLEFLNYLESQPNPN